MQPIDPDPDYLPSDPHSFIIDNQNKLLKVRSKINELYQQEFISTLIKQSIDKNNRYCPVNHKALNIGDIILLKDVYIKPNKYEMAIVMSIVVNDLGEVTDVICKKGKTNELIKRHVILLLYLC